MNNKRPLIIYHRNCSDGFGAALAAWLKYEDKADYVAAQHGDAPPEVKGREVVIIDFAWPRALTETLHSEARSLLVLDHHDTAARNLAGLDYCRFDQSHSGAVLAWQHFHPGRTLPHMFELIEDADLRLYCKGEETARFMAHLKTLPKDFLIWQDLMTEMEKPARRKELMEVYGHTHKHRRAIVHEAARQARLFCLEDGLSGYLVEVEDFQYASDVAEYLAIRAQADGHKGALGVVWRERKDKPGWISGSIRTRDEAVDCQLIALQLGGGGGHPKSSGILIPSDHWKGMLKKVQQTSSN